MTSELARRTGAKGALAALVTAALLPSHAVALPPEASPSKPRLSAGGVPLPPPPPGTTLRRREGATYGVAVGPWAAFDLGQAIALHLDYGLLRTPPGWARAQLEWRLAVMVARPAEETDLTRTVTPPFGPPITISAGAEELRVWLVEVVPMARIRLPLGASFALHADAGLGLAQTLEKRDRQEMFAGHVEETRNVTAPLLRLGVGMSLDLSSSLRLLFDPVVLSLHLGSDFSGFAPTIGLAWRP